jgi:hypothetical protein
MKSNSKPDIFQNFEKYYTDLAKKIKKPLSTISRKLRRNTLNKVIGYLPDEASIKKGK